MKKNFTTILSIAFFLFFKTNIADAQIDKQDSLALVDLYNNTNGINWITKTNWLTSSPVSTWYGITIKENRITEILLDRNNLVGNLPASLGNLTKLTDLIITYNGLKGSISSSLSNLINLENLNFSFNDLSGSIPVSLGNLTKLTSLSFQTNKLTGSIPAALGKLVNLVSLNLNDNRLSGNIPASFGNLTKLQYLDLSGDKLSGSIPASFGNLTNLIYLILPVNKLSGNIPASLGNLTQLQFLDLAVNRLSDTIPASLVKLTSLSTLYLDYNEFTFAGMGRLATAFPFASYSSQANIPLHKNDNILSVSVGSVLANNTYKWYKGATLVATIKGDSTFNPTQNGNYSVAVTNSIATKLTLYSDTVYVKTTINKNDSLALVDLYNSTNGTNWHGHLNWLTSAPVSTWYGVIVTGNRVTELHLGLDNLGGKIPVSIGNLTQLNYLDFSYGHNLHGSIPASIGNLINLSYINFNSCKLNGAIPESVGNLVKLETLYLDDNNLSGEIPSSLANLTNLKILDIGFNKLSGVIPSQLTGLTNLTNLILLYNNFTFAGMGKIATAFPFAVYSPQAKILLHINNDILSVTAGSSVKNNAYKWYKNGTLYKTKVGDSTISVTDEGDYSVVVTNSIATKLALYSDTIDYTAGNNLTASKMNNNSSISLYPNPTKTFATISFNADGKYSITITDVSGKILQTKTGVANKSTNVIQLDVNKYASGVYLITVIDEKNNKQTLRFSKE